MIRPLKWMREVRDARPPFTTKRLAVLWALGLRMDSTGHGYASADQLARDAEVDERTAKRATAEGRDRGYLVQTRRGHRLGNGKVVASEWELTVPAHGDTGVPLTESQGDTGVPLTRSQRDRIESQGDTGVPPRGLSPRGLSAAARAAAIVTKHTDATDTEAAAVVRLIAAERPATRNLAAVVRAIATAGELPDWLERVRADDRRATLSDWLAMLTGMPDCPHGVAGGDQVRPDTGLPQCPMCRKV